MNLNTFLTQLGLWIDSSETVMDSTYYCQNLRLNKDKIVICSNPLLRQKYCLTEDSFYYYEKGNWDVIHLFNISNIRYSNNMIWITDGQKNKHTYTVVSLAPNIFQERTDEIGKAIIYVIRYLKQYSGINPWKKYYEKNNFK
jgi:hypothetical protein